MEDQLTWKKPTTTSWATPLTLPTTPGEIQWLLLMELTYNQSNTQEISIRPTIKFHTMPWNNPKLSMLTKSSSLLESKHLLSSRKSSIQMTNSLNKPKSRNMLPHISRSKMENLTISKLEISQLGINSWKNNIKVDTDFLFIAGIKLQERLTPSNLEPYLTIFWLKFHLNNLQLQRMTTELKTPKLMFKNTWKTWNQCQLTMQLVQLCSIILEKLFSATTKEQTKILWFRQEDGSANTSLS